MLMLRRSRTSRFPPEEQAPRAVELQVELYQLIEARESQLATLKAYANKLCRSGSVLDSRQQHKLLNFLAKLRSSSTSVLQLMTQLQNLGLTKPVMYKGQNYFKKLHADFRWIRSSNISQFIDFESPLANQSLLNPAHPNQEWDPSVSHNRHYGGGGGANGDVRASQTLLLRQAQRAADAVKAAENAGAHILRSPTGESRFLRAPYANFAMAQSCPSMQELRRQTQMKEKISADIARTMNAIEERTRSPTTAKPPATTETAAPPPPPPPPRPELPTHVKDTTSKDSLLPAGASGVISVGLRDPISANTHAISANTHAASYTDSAVQLSVPPSLSGDQLSKNSSVGDTNDDALRAPVPSEISLHSHRAATVDDEDDTAPFSGDVEIVDHDHSGSSDPLPPHTGVLQPAQKQQQQQQQQHDQQQQQQQDAADVDHLSDPVARSSSPSPPSDAVVDVAPPRPRIPVLIVHDQDEDDPDNNANNNSNNNNNNNDDNDNNEDNSSNNAGAIDNDDGGDGRARLERDEDAENNGLLEEDVEDNNVADADFYNDFDGRDFDDEKLGSSGDS